MRKDKECFSSCAAEDELQGTLRHVDLRDLLAGRRIDEDLAVGDINIAVAIDGCTFASTLRKRLEVAKCAVRVHFGAVGDVFRLAADIDALPWLAGEKTVGVEIVAEAPARCIGGRALLKNAACWQKDTPICCDILTRFR